MSASAPRCSEMGIRDRYTMEPHSYAEIPKSIRDKIVEERGKKAE